MAFISLSFFVRQVRSVLCHTHGIGIVSFGGCMLCTCSGNRVTTDTYPTCRHPPHSPRSTNEDSFPHHPHHLRSPRSCASSTICTAVSTPSPDCRHAFNALSLAPLEARTDTRQSGRAWAAIRSGVKCRCVGSTGLWLPGSVKGCSRSAPDSTSTWRKKEKKRRRGKHVVGRVSNMHSTHHSIQHTPYSTQHAVHHTQDNCAVQASLCFSSTILAYLDDLWVIVHDGSN